MSDKKSQTKVKPEAKTKAEQPSAPIIDLTRLTPEQIASLNKQLKERNKENRGKSKERFVIIDGMLEEKNDAGEFHWTTRDIYNKLVENNLAGTDEGDDTLEIKKIQARKQFLEKSTDEKGKLVYPAGSFGYKKTEFKGFQLGKVTVLKFFKDDKKVATLTQDERNIIMESISA